MSKVSVFLDQNIHSQNFDNDYLLLDFAASIYVFHDKDRFTSFKRVIKNQKFLYGIDTIAVES